MGIIEITIIGFIALNSAIGASIIVPILRRRR